MHYTLIKCILVKISAETTCLLLPLPSLPPPSTIWLAIWYYKLDYSKYQVINTPDWVIDSWHLCFIIWNTTQFIRQIYIHSSSLSSSSPCNLFKHFLGKRFCIRFHLFWSTSVPSLMLFRAQFEIRLLHNGHTRFACSTFVRKQGLHISCLHGKTTGSMRSCMHMRHLYSEIEVLLTAILLYSPRIISPGTLCREALP